MVIVSRAALTAEFLDAGHTVKNLGPAPWFRAKNTLDASIAGITSPTGRIHQ